MIEPNLEMPVAPAAPTPDAPAPSFEPRFTTEDRDLLRNGNQDTQRLFADQLTPQEQELILSKGFEAIFKTAPMDPNAPAIIPPVPPTASTDEKPPVVPNSDTPAWMLTPEEYAGADEKTKALFDALLDSQEALSAQKPADDPYAKDPVIAWRRDALSRGDTAIPLAPNLHDLGGVELLRSVDAAFQNEDPKVWIKAMEDLVNTVSTESVARSNVQHQMAVQEAYQAGSKSAELRSELVGFVRSIPDYKDAAEPVVVRGPEGNYILNQEHPAKDFALWIKDQVAAGTLTDAFVMKHGYGPVWTTYQSDKAGGYNKMQANQRERVAKDVVTRMREVKTATLSRAAAPTVGSIPTGASRPAALYHGFTKEQLSTVDGVKAAMNTWDRAGNNEAMKGILPFLQGQPQVPTPQR